MSLSFGALKVFDVLLIKSQAIYILSTTGETDRYKAIVRAISTYIMAKGCKAEFDPKKLIESIRPNMMNGLREKSAEGIIEDVFGYFEKNNIEIIKDPTREDTWSSLSPSLYAVGTNTKKPWIY